MMRDSKYRDNDDACKHRTCKVQEGRGDGRVTPEQWRRHGCQRGGCRDGGWSDPDQRDQSLWPETWTMATDQDEAAWLGGEKKSGERGERIDARSTTDATQGIATGHVKGAIHCTPNEATIREKHKKEKSLPSLQPYSIGASSWRGQSHNTSNSAGKPNTFLAICRKWVTAMSTDYHNLQDCLPCDIRTPADKSYMARKNMHTTFGRTRRAPHFCYDELDITESLSKVK